MILKRIHPNAASRFVLSMAILWLIGLPILMEQYAQGVPIVTITSFKVGIKQIDISKDSGKTWQPLSKEQKEFDIASVTPGLPVGSYLENGSPLEANTTYDRMRLTLGCSYKINGSVADAGTTTYTKNGSNQQNTNPPSEEGSYTDKGAQCQTNPPSQWALEVSTSLKTDPLGGLPLKIEFNATSGLKLQSRTLIPEIKVKVYQ